MKLVIEKVGNGIKHSPDGPSRNGNDASDLKSQIRDWMAE